MALICPSCQKENPDDARFCFSCGTSFTGEAPAATLSTPPPEVAPAPTAKTLPRWLNWRCCGTGCLVVLLVLLIGVPILHVTLLRPAIQGELVKQARRIGDENIKTEKYTGLLRMEDVSEKKVNDSVEDLWKKIPGASNGQVTLKQDQIIFEVKVYGLTLQAQGDVRVDSQGNIVIKSIDMNWVMNLFFTKDVLKTQIASYVNEKILRPNNKVLRAFQVVNGKIFLAYEKR